MGRLSGRAAIVTGAAQGIGAAYAKAMAAEGAKVALCDLQPPDEVVAAIRKSGGEAIGMACDVTDANAVAGLVRATTEAFGGVQVLVNNAAVFAPLDQKPFTEIPSKEWDWVMSVNVRGTFECAKAVVPVMTRQGYGKIINISSGTVFKGVPWMMHYVASKGAVVAMTRVMARELGDKGIRCNAIAPGLTMSEAVTSKQGFQNLVTANLASRCLKREETPEDLAGTVIFLASGESDFITGQTILVDGGSAMH